jgi:hypothetical protein
LPLVAYPAGRWFLVALFVVTDWMSAPAVQRLAQPKAVVARPAEDADSADLFQVALPWAKVARSVLLILEFVLAAAEPESRKAPGVVAVAAAMVAGRIRMRFARTERRAASQRRVRRSTRISDLLQFVVAKMVRLLFAGAIPLIAQAGIPTIDKLKYVGH